MRLGSFGQAVRLGYQPDWQSLGGLANLANQQQQWNSSPSFTLNSSAVSKSYMASDLK